MNGNQLKVKRVKAHVTVKALAAEMMYSPSNISATERQISVDTDKKNRYLKALEAIIERNESE